MKYNKSICKVDVTRQRWINELVDYDFTICGKPGTPGVKNVVASTFSKLPIKDIKDLETNPKLCCVMKRLGYLKKILFKPTWGIKKM